MLSQALSRPMARTFALAVTLSLLLAVTVIYPTASATAETETVSTAAELEAALLDGNVSEIILEPGTYALEVDDDQEIERDLTIRGIDTADREDVIITRDAGGEEWLLWASAGTLNLENLTLTGATDTALWVYDGDADLVVNVDNVVFSGNEGDYSGAIWGEGFGEINVTNSLFEDNDGDSYGGAIGIECDICEPGAEKLTVNGSEFYDNSSDYGGAIFTYGYDSVDISESIFVGNSAAEGGALYLECSSCSNTGMNNVAISNTSFVDNEADYGGAISLYGWNSFELTGSTLSANFAEFDGSAIYFEQWGASADAVLISNSTITLNESGESSALYVEDSVGPFRIVHSTIAANDGVGIYAEADGDNGGPGTVEIANSIVWGNDSDCEGAVVSVGNNIDSDGSCNLDADGDLPEVSEADLDLGPLANNGGPTPTHAISADSVAYEAGNAEHCTSSDQRGVARKDPCDIGAFEVAAPADEVDEDDDPDPEPDDDEDDDVEAIDEATPATPVEEQPDFTG